MTRECDFCSAKITDTAAVFNHKNTKVIVRGHLVDVPAGRFGACETCAGMFREGKTDELAERARRELNADTGTHLLFTHLYRAIFRALIDETSMSAAHDQPVPRFAEHACFRCGQKTTIDQASYDNLTTYRCARCGIEISLVSKVPANPVAGGAKG